MANYYLVLLLLGTIAFAAAKPAPDYEEDGQEVLNSRDTRYYGRPSFWFRRPLTGEDGVDYGTNDGGYIRPTYRRRETKKSVYQNAGAGWGR